MTSREHVGKFNYYASYLDVRPSDGDAHQQIQHGSQRHRCQSASARLGEMKFKPARSPCLHLISYVMRDLVNSFSATSLQSLKWRRLQDNTRLSERRPNRSECGAMSDINTTLKWLRLLDADPSEIFWGCVFAITASTFLTLHLNVPPAYPGRFSSSHFLKQCWDSRRARLIRRQTLWSLMVIIAPELLVSLAFGD